MFKESGKGLSLFFLVLAVLIAFGAGFSVGKSQNRIIPIEGVVNTGFGQPEAVDFSLFWDAWRVLQEKYAQRDSFNVQEMVYGAIEGTVESLGDPYTVFMDPEEAKRFKDDISGSFEGVGMEIGIRSGELRVIAPLEGTPAQEVGLRPKDVIVKIDDTFTRNMGIEEAVSLIRGPKGSEVILAVIREKWSEPKDFVIVRAVIEIPSLELELRDDNVVYIQLFHFSEKARRTFAEAATQILQSSADRIVLDLRGNPGGFLEVAVDIAGWFLERGQTVVVEDFGEQGKEKTYNARGNARLASYPLVILINEGSASASEILAGALRDHKGVSLVGEQSFGKGSVQELEALRGGASLKVTVANWLTPNGHLITDVGLEPDVRLELTPEDFDQELDPQLDKALELVKDL